MFTIFTPKSPFYIYIKTLKVEYHVKTLLSWQYVLVKGYKLIIVNIFGLFFKGGFKPNILENTILR